MIRPFVAHTRFWPGMRMSGTTFIFLYLQDRCPSWGAQFYGGQQSPERKRVPELIHMELAAYAPCAIEFNGGEGVAGVMSGLILGASYRPHALAQEARLSRGINFHGLAGTTCAEHQKLGCTGPQVCGSLDTRHTFWPASTRARSSRPITAMRALPVAGSKSQTKRVLCDGALTPMTCPEGTMGPWHTAPGHLPLDLLRVGPNLMISDLEGCR